MQTEQDIEGILGGIARDREVQQRGDTRRAATLPAFVVENLTHRGIYDDPDALKKWLNGPEAAEWRIWRGEV